MTMMPDMSLMILNLITNPTVSINCNSWWKQWWFPHGDSTIMNPPLLNFDISCENQWWFSYGDLMAMKLPHQFRHLMWKSMVIFSWRQQGFEPSPTNSTTARPTTMLTSPMMNFSTERTIKLPSDSTNSDSDILQRTIYRNSKSKNMKIKTSQNYYLKQVLNYFMRKKSYFYFYWTEQWHTQKYKSAISFILKYHWFENMPFKILVPNSKLWISDNISTNVWQNPVFWINTFKISWKWYIPDYFHLETFLLLWLKHSF